LQGFQAPIRTVSLGVSSNQQEGELAEFTLRIEGMHCGSCIRRVTEALAATPTVHVKEVRLGAARIESDQVPAPIDRALAVIQKAGYSAHLDSVGGTNPTHAE